MGVSKDYLLLALLALSLCACSPKKDPTLEAKRSKIENYLTNCSTFIHKAYLKKEDIRKWSGLPCETIMGRGKGFDKGIGIVSSRVDFKNESGLEINALDEEGRQYTISTGC